jgi:ABC-type microcin C transport system permease subunit YejE
MSKEKKTTFEAAGAEKEASLLRELVRMMKNNKKYWLMPLVLFLLLFGILVILGSSVAAPFIYTIF